MRARNLCLLLTAVLQMSLGGAAIAQEDRTVDVQFERGASGTTINETIRGYAGVNYRLAVSAGQRMSVQLDTDNASNYFNITAPGADAAMFIGSIEGNSTTFEVPSSGTYVISVYLMRNAARRDERANYSLTVYVEANPSASAPPPLATPPMAGQPVEAQPALDTAQMTAFCVGEAAGEYNTRPAYVSAEQPLPAVGGGYVVTGSVDRGAQGSPPFQCLFDEAGYFRTIEWL